MSPPSAGRVNVNNFDHRFLFQFDFEKAPRNAIKKPETYIYINTNNQIQFPLVLDIMKKLHAKVPASIEALVKVSCTPNKYVANMSAYNLYTAFIISNAHCSACQFSEKSRTRRTEKFASTCGSSGDASTKRGATIGTF